MNIASTSTCLERLRLSALVSTAVEDVYAAKIARDRAVTGKNDPTPYTIALGC